MNTTINDYSENINILWVSTCTFLVFFMQAGFAFLEAGTIREKNVQNILIKNLLDICACTIVWWLLGYGFAYGESSGKFIGNDKFASENFNGTNEYTSWMFQWAFAGTAATIVSGCLAERTQIISYVIFSLFITGFIYPIVVHWTWGGGWLYQEDFLDFAGSSIVHLVGGLSGLIGSIIVGARHGKFDENNNNEFKPHNVPMVVLGTLILWFGWYGFNCGSTLSIVDGNEFLVSKIGMNTTISAAIAGLACFIISALIEKSNKSKYNVNSLTNGILAGLVSITAGCNSVEPYGAFVIGMIGAFVYICFSKLLIKYKIDDPLDAFAVHGGCGIWGTFALGFFDINEGVFYGGNGKQIGIQLMGIIVISLWTSFMSFCLFYLLNKFKLLRIPKEEEILGIDWVEHGGKAYHINDDNNDSDVNITDENNNSEHTVSISDV